MSTWRRGKEAPMQWEFTSHPQASQLPLPTTTIDEDAAMDITLQQPEEGDESLRDVSMAAADDVEEPIASQAGPLNLSQEVVEEIPRNGATGSSSALISSSQTSRQRPRNRGTRSRRRRSNSSATGSSRGSRGDSDDDDEADDSTILHQWPMVGTVINYLVPPVEGGGAGGQHHNDGSIATSNQAGGSSSAADKAHATLHPRERPLLLLSYAQLTFNASLLLLCLYVVFALVWTIRLDVVERLKEIEDAYHHSVSTCQRSYELNCLLIPLPPALQAPCLEWERCSSRRFTDVLGGSRLRIVIEVLSEAWEAGVGGLGWRTLVFSLLVLSIVVGGANSTLNGLRMGVWRKSKDGERRRSRQEERQDERIRIEQNRGSSTAAIAPSLTYPASPYGNGPTGYPSHQGYGHPEAFQSAYAAQQYLAANGLPPMMLPPPSNKYASQQPTRRSTKKKGGGFFSSLGKSKVKHPLQQRKGGEVEQEEWIDES